MSLEALKKSLAKSLGLSNAPSVDLAGKHTAKMTAEQKQEAELADRAARGKQFMAAFGRQGAVWFSEGKTFAEAEKLFHELHGSDGQSLRNAGLSPGLSRVAAAMKLPK